MITLYGLALSFPVNRVRFCLNAMDLEYDFVSVNPLAGETQTEEYLKIHPVGKIPALDDDGFVLFESNAIMKYLCRKHDSEYYPDETKAQAIVDQWSDFTTIHLANGIMKVAFNKLLAPVIEAEVDEVSIKDGYNFINRFLPIINDRLGTSAFLAGDNMTIADFCLLGTIDPVDMIDIDLSEHPHVDAWRKNLMAKDFYKRVHNSYSESYNALMAG